MKKLITLKPSGGKSREQLADEVMDVSESKGFRKNEGETLLGKIKSNNAARGVFEIIFTFVAFAVGLFAIGAVAAFAFNAPWILYILIALTVFYLIRKLAK